MFYRKGRKEVNLIGGSALRQHTLYLIAPTLFLLSAISTVVPSAAKQLPVVVAADGVLCDLSRTLASNRVQVVCLVPPGANPHSFVLKPSDRRSLDLARLILINGYGLTPTLRKIRDVSTVVPVAERAVPQNQANADPHVWHDPAQAKAMLMVVRNHLQMLVGPNQKQAKELQRRAWAAANVLDDLATWTTDQISTVPRTNRVLVSEHRAFSAFARRYDIREIPLIDDYTTGGMLRPDTLRKITKSVRASGTQVLFAEALPPSKTLSRMSQSSAIPVASAALVADGLAFGRSLIQTATDNVCTFVTAQGGSCDNKGAGVLQQRWATLRMNPAPM